MHICTHAYNRCWGSYIEKVTSYKLLVTYYNLVIVTCNKVIKYLVTSYFYVIFAIIFATLILRYRIKTYAYT